MREGPAPEMPAMPMAQPGDSRPPSASGERSRALSQGFVKISEADVLRNTYTTTYIYIYIYIYIYSFLNKY